MLLELISLCKTVSTIITDKKTNQRRLNRLKSRITYLQIILEYLNENPDSNELKLTDTDNILQPIKAVLLKSEKLCQKHSRKWLISKLIHFDYFRTGKYKMEFILIHEEINDVIAQLDLKLGLKTSENISSLQQSLAPFQDAKIVNEETCTDDLIADLELTKSDETLIDEFMRDKNSPFHKLYLLLRQTNTHGIINSTKASILGQINRAIELIQAEQPKNENSEDNARVIMDTRAYIPFTDIDITNYLENNPADPWRLFEAEVYKTPVIVTLYNESIFEKLTSSEDTSLFEREIRLRQRLAHPNIATFIGASCDLKTHTILTLTEKLDDTLYALLDREVPTPTQQRTMIKEIALALNYLHGKGMIHRHLSSHAIYLTKTGSVKLGDFYSVGRNHFSGKQLQSLGSDLASSEIQTNPWQDPLLKEFSHTTDSDIYSFGVIVWEIVTGCHPSAEAFDLAFMIDKMKTLQVDEHFQKLVTECCKKDLIERPNLSEIINQLDPVRPTSPTDAMALATEGREKEQAGDTTGAYLRYEASAKKGNPLTYRESVRLVRASWLNNRNIPSAEKEKEKNAEATLRRKLLKAG